MRRFLLLFFAVLLLTAPVSASVNGEKQPAFVRAVKAKKIQIRRVRVGKTLLAYDKAVKPKHIKNVKKWIKALPPSVQIGAKRVYLLTHAHYYLTGTKKELYMTYGYYLYSRKEVYLYPHRGMQDTLYHEFGHAFDSYHKLHSFSMLKAWRKIKPEDPVEEFAISFADLFCLLTEPEYLFIHKLIY